ncbi:MAG: mycofactocin-associated electron transfer flavoprotein alpha subunit, partial [Actinomycetota bacterium]
MIAVVVVRSGQLPAGAAEAVAECDGRALLIGTGTVSAAAELVGLSTDVTCAEVGDAASAGGGAGVFRPAALSAALAALLADEPVIVLPASPDGRDLAPRLAALLQRPLWASAVQVTPARVDLARNGSTELHRVSPGERFVATLQPGVRGVTVTAGAAAPSLIQLDIDLTVPRELDPTVTAVLPPDPATIDLAEAPHIVAGGAGLDSSERMDQLARIGVALGASVGATRVVTDRGWAPHARQIGTTGVVIDPDLYLAFGISGAVQHTSGLGNPEHIISVNTDAHCPMMQLADLAITAEANAT